jgi:hypothetical protein
MLSKLTVAALLLDDLHGHDITHLVDERPDLVLQASLVVRKVANVNRSSIDLVLLHEGFVCVNLRALQDFLHVVGHDAVDGVVAEGLAKV